MQFVSILHATVWESAHSTSQCNLPYSVWHITYNVMGNWQLMLWKQDKITRKNVGLYKTLWTCNGYHHMKLNAIHWRYLHPSGISLCISHYCDSWWFWIYVLSRWIQAFDGGTRTKGRPAFIADIGLALAQLPLSLRKIWIKLLGGIPLQTWISHCPVLFWHESDSLIPLQKW